MNDNESVISFEIDTAKIDKSIEKLKEALPQSFHMEVERIKKGIDSLNKQTEALLQKQTKQHANTQKQLQQQLLKQEKEYRELPKSQHNQYTKDLSNLQEQYKDLQSDYKNTDNSDITQLKEAIKKQQENLNNQAYNIKQARLQNASPLLSAVQKKANKIQLDKRIELFNKQKQNTMKNAMNLDKASQNIRANAKNIAEQKNNPLKLGFNKMTVGILSLTGVITKLISIFNSYNNLKYNLMNTQKFANTAQISFNEARAFKELSRQTQDPQILQLVNAMGNLQNYPQFNNQALQLIGLNREGLLKMKVGDRVFNLLKHYQSKFNTLSDLEKGILNDMFTSDLGVSRDYLKELTGSFNKGGYSFIQHYRAIYDETNATLLQQKNKIDRDKILKGITKADIEGSKAEIQSQQADLFKLSQLSNLHAVTNNLLYSINTLLTKIYSTIDKINNAIPFFNNSTIFKYSLHDAPTTSHNHTSAYNGMIMTNKANQGGMP